MIVTGMKAHLIAEYLKIIEEHDASPPSLGGASLLFHLLAFTSSQTRLKPSMTFWASMGSKMSLF